MKFELIGTSNNYQLIKSNSTESRIIIPSEYNGRPVTQIGKKAFQKNNHIIEVVIPNSIKIIGTDAFSNCTNLEKVTFSKSIIEIEDSAFSDCKSLKSFTLPINLKRIGNYAFNNCTSLEVIKLPESLKSIGDRAFYSCSSLMSISIPYNVKIISEYLFAFCSKLVKVQLHDNISLIKIGAFFNCPLLAKINIPRFLKKIPNDCFKYCASLKSIELSRLREVGANAFEYSGLVSSGYGGLFNKIGDRAFSNCQSLKEFFFSHFLTNLGEYAFYGSALKSVSIPSRLTSISKGAFENCKALTRVSFASYTKALKTIGESAFAGSAISSLSIEEGIKTISKKAFSNCKSLNLVTIYGDLERIEEEAFSYCDNLDSFRLGSSLKLIGKKSFYNCSKLVLTYIPGAPTKIGEDAFEGVEILDPFYLKKKKNSFVNEQEETEDTTIDDQDIEDDDYEDDDEQSDDDVSENEYCFWCEEEAPNVKFRDNLDDPICEDCYRAHLKNIKADHNQINFESQTTKTMKKDVVSVNQFVSNKMSNKEARWYFYSCLADSSYISSMVDLKYFDFIEEFALPLHYYSLETNEIVLSSISHLEIPSKPCKLEGTNQLVKVHFSKPNSIKHLREKGNKVDKKSIFMSFSEIEKLIDLKKVKTTYQEEEVLLYEPSDTYFIEPVNDDNYFETEENNIVNLEITSDVFSESNFNLFEVLGVFSFEGIIAYYNNLISKKTSVIKFSAGSVQVNDIKLPIFYEALVNIDKFQKQLKEYGIIQLKPLIGNQTQLLIVSLKDALQVATLLDKLKRDYAFQMK